MQSAYMKYVICQVTERRVLTQYNSIIIREQLQYSIPSYTAIKSHSTGAGFLQ